MEWYELAQELDLKLRNGDLELCLTRAIEVMRQFPALPFHEDVGLEFNETI